MTNNYEDSGMKYRKKPVVVEASQWFKNGDHPLDHEPIGIQALSRADLYKYSEYLETEGSVVRYFRHPEVSGETACKHCSKAMHKHGWIDTLEGGHIVCPGDWIITGVANEMYPCKPDIFAETYEPVVQEETDVSSLKVAADRLGREVLTVPLPEPSAKQPLEVSELVEALEQVERWDGFPSTGKMWEGSGEPVSYGAAFGSNGERDFMREVARKALASHRKAVGDQP